MDKYAFWNNGRPERIPSTACVVLPDGSAVLNVNRSRPEYDIYRYVENPGPESSYLRAVGKKYSLVEDTIYADYVVEWIALADAISMKSSQLAAARYKRECGGMIVSGQPFATDRDCQAKLIALRILAKEDPEFSVLWKSPSGFVTLSSSEIIAISDAVRKHVQSCFDAEAEHMSAIMGMTTTAEIEEHDIATGWPAD